MLFDSRTVYLGASRDKYEQYCKALDSEKIKYKTKRVNHEEKMIAPGRGTARSMGGNFGTDKTLYEIPEEESMQKSVQDNVQDNGNPGGVLWENINRHLQ